jgi:hypothetical protein
MSDAYADIGAAEAAGVLAEAQASGQQISLSHRGATANTLRAIVDDVRLSADRPQAMRSVETYDITVIIPDQTNFSAQITGTSKPITKGDRIEYPLLSGAYFYVQSEEDIELIANGFIYKVKATSRKSLTLGVKS